MISKNIISILKKFSKILPSVFVIFLLGMVGISMTDTIMVGRLGSKYLGASSFSNSLYAVFFLFSIGSATSLTPLYSKYTAQKNYIKTVKILKHALIYGFILALLLYFLANVIIYNLDFFKPKNEISELSKPYLKILSFSFFFNCIKDILRSFINGIGKNKTAMIFTIISFLSNIILNYILIYGKLGFPRLELTGAGIATCTCRFIEFVLPSLYIIFHLKKYNLLSKFFEITINKNYFLTFLKICVPSGFQLTLEIGFLSILNIIVSWLGILPLAIHAIAFNISQLGLIFPLSIAVTSSIIVGKYLGEKNILQIKNTAYTAYIMNTIFLFIFSIFFIIFRTEIFEFYKPSDEVFLHLLILMPFIILFFFFDGFNIININLLRGIQNSLISVLSTLICLWLIGIPMSYILAFYFNLNILGVWISLVISFLISSIILIFIFFNRIKYIKF